MGAGHGHRLHFHGHSAVHRAPAHLKLARAGRLHARRGRHPARVVRRLRASTCSSCSSSSRCSRVPLGYLAKRMVDRGAVRAVRGAGAVRRRPARRSRCSGVSVSEPGLRGRLGRCSSRAPSACSPRSPWPRPPSRRTSCVGLQRLRMPDLLVQIMGFMIRYLDVVTAELGRMITAHALARLRPALAAALAGAGPVARRAVHPLLRARRAGPPRDAVARLRPAPCRTDAADGTTSEHLMATPVLDVRGLAYAYPDGHQALFGVDLHVHQGERVALLGPNGAGKTTLVLHLNGILTAGAGIGRGQRAAGRQGEPQGDPPPGRHRLPGPRRPALHAAPSARTSPSGRPTSGSRAPSSTAG